MLGGEVHGEPPPEPSAQEAAQVVGEGVLSMDVEVIHHQMNGPCAGIGRDHALHHPSKLGGRAVGCGTREMPAGFRFDDRKEVRRPAAAVLMIAFDEVAGARRRGGRTSAWRETGFSSRHTTGSFRSYGFSYRARSSSILAM